MLSCRSHFVFVRGWFGVALINVVDLTFAHEGSYDNVFENVSFQIDSNWKLGFVGRNGRGKTTFLNLLLGRYEYAGLISSNIEFEYFPFEVEDKQELTVNIVKQRIPEVADWEIKKELAKLQVENDRLYCPFELLSGGEQVKILLVVLFLKKDRFLLIDEPTNHLDMQARKIVGEYLNSKSGYILVSHDRDFLDRCVDHILAINKINIELQRGNFSSWFENKKRLDQFEKEQNEKLLKEINRFKIAASKTANWSDKVEQTKNIGRSSSGIKLDKGYVGHQSAKMMKRSKVLETRQQTAMKEKSKLLKNIEATDSLKLTCLKYHQHNLVRLREVSLFYGSKSVTQAVSFEINQGDRIALCGQNGSGKSSIIKLIINPDEVTFGGEFHKASELKVSYLPQNIENLRGSLDDFIRQNETNESLFNAILRKLDFKREQLKKDIANFSAGQRKKILLAQSLCESSHLFLWDEPLNYIDLFSRFQIEELLLRYKPTIMFVEHDKAFAQNIATKVVEL